METTYDYETFELSVMACDFAKPTSSGEMKYTFSVNPMPAPRMNHSDRWAGRDIVQRYFSYRSTITLQARVNGLEVLPDTLSNLIFYMPVPPSWSNKKTADNLGQPHTQRPDLDNLIKGFLDAFGEDSHIHSLTASKVWSEIGRIELILTQ